MFLFILVFQGLSNVVNNLQLPDFFNTSAVNREDPLTAQGTEPESIGFRYRAFARVPILVQILGIAIDTSIGATLVLTYFKSGLVT
ncbi:hypothetical protein AB205_0025430 [Aquarana catesbeiana]|uniref:ABC transmembrane type-1 domain-containing protein n=1 Tax=Aquarana catesbeiana TaxID=8400 RepID=A0A2G9QKD8_AQUCT|nr:hypothetical protein AB205_0025430 [Aquarana catesbeiana]